MMTFLTDKKILVGLGSLFVAIVIAAVAGYYLRINFNQLLAETAALATFRANTLHRSAVLILAREIAADQPRLAAYFISPDKAASFIEQLEFLGRTSGVVLTLNQAIVKTELNLEIYAAGTFDQIMTFLQLLSAMPYQTEINYTNLTQSPDRRWSAAISLALKSFQN